jgi:hypothetical protein
MRDRGRRRVAACVGLSLLLHVFLLAVAGYLPTAQPASSQFAIRLDATSRPETRPFERPRGVYVPPELFSLRWSAPGAPLRRHAALLVDGEWLLERGMVEADSALSPTVARVDVDGGRSQPDRLLRERQALQSWRDSLDLQLTLTPEERRAELPLSPFELAIKAGFLGETVVVVDPETGRLIRASWRLPVYGHEACPGCTRYDSLYRDFEDRFEEILGGVGLPNVTADLFPIVREQRLQPLPIRAVLEDGYDFNAQESEQEEQIDHDPIHTYGWQPYRDVLDSTDIGRFPVLLLQWIDPESTEVLVRYLAAGGFVMARRRQLESLETALARHLGRRRVERVGIWSNHALMGSHYTIDDYYEAPRQANDAPVDGLQVDGRLVAVTLRSRRREVFVNAVVFGLIQPGGLSGRYPAAEETRR